MSAGFNRDYGPAPLSFVSIGRAEFSFSACKHGSDANEHLDLSRPMMHTKLHMWDPQWRLCMWSQGAGATPDTSVPPAAPLTGVKYKVLNLSV